MAGIGVQEIKKVEISTTDGQKIKEGDLIVIGVKGQDVVCRFAELDKGGYFVTVPVVGGPDPVKYRVNSITFCYKVKAFQVDKKPNAAADAAEVAADHADQDTLAPAAL